MSGFDYDGLCAYQNPEFRLLSRLTLRTMQERMLAVRFAACTSEKLFMIVLRDLGSGAADDVKVNFGTPWPYEQYGQRPVWEPNARRLALKATTSHPAVQTHEQRSTGVLPCCLLLFDKCPMVADSNTLIPRTSNWRLLRSFYSVADLNPIERQSLKDAIYDYWNRMPVSEQRKTWVKLPEQTRIKFLLEITDRCPFLRRFENAWPAEAWMRYRMEKGGGLTYSTTKYHHVTPQRIRTYVGREPLSNRAGGTNAGCSIRDAGEEDTQPRPDDDAHVKQSTVVSRFLASLSPNMSNLTDRFLQNGVRTEEDLVGLANMPEAYRSHFLQLDMLLTSFQATVVRVGLAQQYQSRV